MDLPPKDPKEINNRIEIVDFFIKESATLKDVINLLKEIGDLDRMAGKISTLKISPRELNKFKDSLASSLKNLLSKSKSNKIILELYNNYYDCSQLIEKLMINLNEDAPVLLSKGNVIKSGVDNELDSYRDLATSSERILDEIKEREISRTGISSLKISYNNVFGYYLEVRNTHKDKVPADWIRKQTLVNAERYITEELKELEAKIINAKEKISILESDIYYKLINSISSSLNHIQANSNIVSIIDCLSCFAIISTNNNYHKPIVNDDYILDVQKGRHPVIETTFESINLYIPNNVLLNNINQQVLMITGPNMSKVRYFKTNSINYTYGTNRLLCSC